MKSTGLIITFVVLGCIRGCISGLQHMPRQQADPYARHERPVGYSQEEIESAGRALEQLLHEEHRRQQAEQPKKGA